MRVLILGGTVFLSAALTRLALERGHQVTCLARGADHEPPAGARFVRADRDQGTPAYDGVVEDWDAVLDVSRQPRHVREALAALAERASHWTFVSTASVYAHFDDPVGMDETAELLPAFEGDGPSTPETYGEAKVACEQACLESLGDRLHISRAGLIAGYEDLSDRFGYWPARFARTGSDPVLVPDARSDRTQVIGVADLARWLLDVAERGVSGTFNAVGDAVALGEVVDLAAQVAGSEAEQVVVDGEWLAEAGVEYWAGPESLPLWLPPTYTGFGARSNAAAVAAGLQLSPPADLMTECLDWERELGLDRERRAGLSSAREAELLTSWAQRG
ncbi:MAG: NAD-dependent epimerase/dehydratase family protein [Propionibacteriaceae bacterium]